MDAYTRGYRRAAHHLRSAGLVAAPCRDELQQMWSEGDREDRQLVAEISSRWEITQ